MILALLIMLGYLIAGIVLCTALFLAGLGGLAIYHLWKWWTSR